MAFDIDGAKAAGYSDEEIQAYLAEESKKPKKQAEPPAPMADEPPPPEKLPAMNDSRTTDTISNEMLAAAGLGAAGAAVPVAGYYGVKKILSPAIRGGAELLNRGVGAAEAANATAQATEARVAANQAARAAAAAPRPVAPTAPSPILGANGQPIRPVAPTAVPPAVNAVQGAQAAQTGGNWMANAMNMARQYAPAMAKLGVGTAMMAPTSTGPAVPSMGRMRGMEINPLTGRPWTPDQIAQYEANPAVYDQQMAAPQFRR